MTPLAGRTALVTGAAGFVGPYVVRALIARGVRVHGAGNVPLQAALPIVSWQAIDLEAPESLTRALSATRPDLVVHLAGQSSAALSFEKPVETFRINALGTWNLLEAVRREAPGARILAVTSGEAYGPIPEGTRAAEDAPLRPVSPYALSKAAADAFAAIAAERGQDVVRARAFGHSGPGQEPRFVIPSLARQIAAIEAGHAEPVIHVGNLDVTRDLTHVRDVAEAYCSLLERAPAGGAYNVCSGAGVKLGDVAEQLRSRAKVAVRLEPDPARMRPSDIPFLVGDPQAAERDTGWRASTPLERLLDDVLADARQRAVRAG